MAKDYVGTIRALLNKAEHPNTPREEAEALAAKAAKLMKAKGIEEAQIRAARGDAPEEVTLLILELPTEHETVFFETVYPMLKAMGAEALCDTYSGEMTVVGTRSLLASIEILISSVQLQMVGAANKAGDEHEAKLRRQHRDWSEDRIADVTDQWVWDYIRGYGLGLGDKIRARVGELADEAPGNALVLRTEADRIRDWYKQKFPHTGKLSTQRVRNGDAIAKGRQDGRNTDIGDARVNSPSGVRRAID
ncbi:DUF2786 domain-containing protein [Actinomadura sp. WMMA1423]|uniref:DUF2786 domain-containing protein n=1 Tax=Actinomadura sp. WMMA1423 TaxID=2591108 RepID=UPI0011477319|nr:DUF2786 domain-containing protein [Actinomadura sp. WMMA1423]